MKQLRLLKRIINQNVKLVLMLIGVFISTTGWAQLPTAQQVANQMKVGWNLGNSLEAICGESAWGNPAITQQLINSVKAAGFNTVRIPVSWDCHTTNGVIDPNWMSRVKTVVDYCTSQNMYVIINIHWDNGWLTNRENITTSAQSAVNAKQRNLWTQIANYFKNYNEHLLFASTNEPDVADGDATAMSVLLSYHQTFINVVRGTGGNNSSRTLIVQGPGTDIDRTNTLMNTMPTDNIASRLMVEVHYYSPYQFCLMTADASWGVMAYYWGNGYHSTTETSRNATWGEESEVERAFGLMKTKFVDKGIPVLLGEFGAIKRTNAADMSLHLASRAYFNKYVVSSAMKKGIVPVYWDNGAADFSLFNRSTGAVTDQAVITAMMQGAGGTTNTYKTIKNRATGLMIDGMGRTTNGSNVGQWASGGSPNQQWIMETSGSYVKFKNRATGLYLDGMGRTTNGSIAGQWSASGVNQEWTMETVGSYSKFKNRGTGLYLDGLGSTTNGADLAQWASSSSNNQQWTVTTITARAATEEVTKQDLGNSVQVFPNPFTSAINVVVTDPEKIKSIIMYDVTGRQVEIVERDHIAKEQAIGSLLSPGIYVMKVNGFDKIHSARVIKK
jgi:endoglucanase